MQLTCHSHCRSKYYHFAFSFWKTKTNKQTTCNVVLIIYEQNDGIWKQNHYWTVRIILLCFSFFYKLVSKPSQAFVQHKDIKQGKCWQKNIINNKFTTKYLHKLVKNNHVWTSWNFRFCHAAARIKKINVKLNKTVRALSQLHGVHDPRFVSNRGLFIKRCSPLNVNSALLSPPPYLARHWVFVLHQRNLQVWSPTVAQCSLSVFPFTGILSTIARI